MDKGSLARFSCSLGLQVPLIQKRLNRSKSPEMTVTKKITIQMPSSTLAKSVNLEVEMLYRELLNNVQQVKAIVHLFIIYAKVKR